MSARAARAPGVDEALEDLIVVSRATGSDTDLVQGGGGNTSVKSRDGQRMLVKAAGSRLADVNGDSGWAEVDLGAALAILDRADLAAMPASRREVAVLRLLENAVLRPRGARPSVETSLHALLDRVVIHTHPVGLNALLCSRDARRKAAALFGRLRPAPLFVPYVNPGYTLAVRVRDEIEAYARSHGSRPQVVLLGSHGVFVSAPDVKRCLALTRQVAAAGLRWIGTPRVNPRVFPAAPASPPDLRRAAEPATAVDQAVEVRGALLRGGAAPALVRRDDGSVAARFLARPSWIRTAARGAFTPDQIFYCRTRPLVLPPAKAAGWAGEVGAYRERHRRDPRVLIVPGSGVYYAAKDLSLLKVVGEVYRSAMVALSSAARAGGPRLLDAAATRFIEEWEVDVYGGSPAGTAGAAQPLAGRVAAVTGAGSGLGMNIAIGLLRAGATVFGLDIDGAAVAGVAAAQPWGRFVPVACDVTTEAPVAAAFALVSRSAGGIDFLVNAAGIAPSFPLVDFPLAAWQKALEINLTGYFLAAREAARLLTRQGAGGGIVNVSSKSGFEASKGNSAYNATKAGEIHLMRGWALELGRAGVRVNCVAPGNVFKGSRIWNDQYIRDRARQKGIRPDEVIPYYNSLTALGKEIEPEDIANAVVFLFSDASRNVTGQTLVVDGGQVMVR